jgi:pyrroline-5-carboxylate reductase
MSKLGVIGFGNMASAIVGGILQAGILTPADLTLYDLDADKTLPLQKKGARLADSAAQVAESSEYVLLAVKPQNFPELLPLLRPAAQNGRVFISIAAGISADNIRAVLGEDAKIITVMPNTPILAGFGTAALSYGPPTTPEEFAFVLQLFKAAGEACEIPQSLMNEVIPLNGSSPAFIYYIAKVFVDEAEKLGFDRHTANRLFCTSLIGSAHMMLDMGMDHQPLIDMVCSKGGTTIAGLEAMQQAGLAEALRAGISACIRRAYELGE